MVALIGKFLSEYASKGTRKTYIQAYNIVSSYTCPTCRCNFEWPWTT